MHNSCAKTFWQIKVNLSFCYVPHYLYYLLIFKNFVAANLPKYLLLTKVYFNRNFVCDDYGIVFLTFCIGCNAFIPINLAVNLGVLRLRTQWLNGIALRFPWKPLYISSA